MRIRERRFEIRDCRFEIAICNLQFATLGVLLLAWALRLYRLSAQSLWYDEGYCAFVAALPLREIIRWTAREFTPPLYHVSLSLWAHLAGQGEFTMRFLSALTGLLTVAAFVPLGTIFYSRRAGILAGLLAALSPFYVWHSQDARMYMPQALAGLVGTLCLLRALRTPSQWRWWLGLALADTAALYTHTTGGFLFVFHALVLLAAGALSKRLALWARGGVALMGALLAWLPWLVYAFPFLGRNAGYWPGRLNWSFVAWGAFRGFVTGQVMGGAAETVTLAAWGVACAAGLLVLLITGHWKTAFFLLAYSAVPATAMAWLFRDVPKFSPRYLILASPPVMLLPAVGIASTQGYKYASMQVCRWADLRTCRLANLVTVLVLISLATTAGLGLRNLYFDPAFAKSDFRTAARLVREGMQPDEIVLIVPGHTFPVWQYYFGETGWVALPDDPILDVRHTLYYPNTVARLNQALAGRSGVWLVEWEPWQIDPTGLVEQLLGQVGEEVPLAEQPTGMRLVHFRLHADRLPLPPEPAVIPPARDMSSLPLGLDGCALPENAAGDRPLHIACYWRARGALPEHLSVSVRLIDVVGTEWGRADAAISGPYLVAGRWPLDESVLGNYTVQPAPGIPPGNFYQLRLLVYEPNGALHGEYIVAPVTIARPSHPFSTEATGAGLVPVQAGLGGLTLEAASIQPSQVLPDEEVKVEALWRVDGPFDEPRLVVEGQSDEHTLLPQPGATCLWQPGDRYRTVSRVLISPHALGGEIPLWAISADGRVQLGVVTVDAMRIFTLPARVPPLDYRLGDAIALVGAERACSGTTCDIVLYWQTDAVVTQTYTVFVQLIGPDGTAHAQADSWPQSGRHPTNHWLPGEVVPDPYRLTLSADAPAGTYRIIAGMYDLATMERLPVTDAAGNPVSDNAILLGEFTFP